MRVFKEALGCLPEGMQKVRLHSDTTTYQPVLKYCDVGENERFGRIEFAINQPLILFEKASWTWELSYLQIRWWILVDSGLCDTGLDMICCQ